MCSSRLQMLIWTLLVIINPRTHSRYTISTRTNLSTIRPTVETSTSFLPLSRRTRAEEKFDIIDLLPQADICHEFVESRPSSQAAANPSEALELVELRRRPLSSYDFQSPFYPNDSPQMDCIKLIKGKMMVFVLSTLSFVHF